MGAVKSFIDEGFLLQNAMAETLYHDYAKNMPIIDYHNHLSSQQLAEDTLFNTITQLWLEGDHYKWRAMRSLGIDEKYITGTADDTKKFMKWAQTVPYTVGNPLYHWTHLELQRYFGVKAQLSPANAMKLYQELNEKIQGTDYSARQLIAKMKVEVLCTTEDPTDSLEHHKILATSDFKTKVSTTFRPDKALLIENEAFTAYVTQLGQVANTEISTYQQFLEVLKKRIHYFNDNGCRLSDHGLPHLYAETYTEAEVAAVFRKRLDGVLPDKKGSLAFKNAVLVFLCQCYHELGWVQQFHLGPLRNTNSRKFAQLGPDTGFDTIGDYPQGLSLARFLDRLDTNDQLAKTILYNLNPSDNAVFAAMIGNFNDGSSKGKVQWGSGWWFSDQKEGMEQQLKTLSTIGLVSCFVGMLTDSRSFLSFPRHEYFRRILCNLMGTQMAQGELPHDMEWIGKIVQDICYHNAKAYFDF